MKSFTDFEQSNRLAEILPPESADMKILSFGIDIKRRVVPIDDIAVLNREDERPCWSLAALLNVLPDYVSNRCVEYHTIICNGLTDAITASGYTFIDACVEMIEKLDKEGYFKKK